MTKYKVLKAMPRAKVGDVLTDDKRLDLLFDGDDRVIIHQNVVDSALEEGFIEEINEQNALDKLLQKYLADSFDAYFDNKPGEYQEILTYKAKQSLKALVTEMVNEIIGEDEQTDTPISMRDPEANGANELRAEMRQRAKAKIERRFL